MVCLLKPADPTEVKIEVAEALKSTEAEKQELVAKSKLNTDTIVRLNLASLEERRAIVKTIENFGLDDMNKSAGRNAAMQAQIMGVDRIWGENSGIVSGLNQLGEQMKMLDPANIDFNVKGFFGKLFNPMKNYFEMYEKADASINTIIVGLEKGRSVLRNDNVTLEIEEAAVRELTQKLAKDIELGELMISQTEDLLNNSSKYNLSDDKIRFIAEEIIEPLRQRIFDLQQLTVVNQQAIVTMEVLRRNNKELIRGVDRARTVTLTALRTAVTVASSLYNQKLVLKKIETLNGMTNSMVGGTASMLRGEGTDIQRRALDSNSTSVEALKAAFEDTFDALDTISDYKLKAVAGMRDTANQFRALAEQSDERLRGLENN